MHLWCPVDRGTMRSKHTSRVITIVIITNRWQRGAREAFTDMTDGVASARDELTHASRIVRLLIRVTGDPPSSWWSLSSQRRARGRAEQLAHRFGSVAGIEAEVVAAARGAVDGVLEIGMEV